MGLRIPGLASGMDTDMMVESMMKAERLKVSRYEQSKQISLWRQEAYNSMNKMFANFILNTKKDLGLNKTTSTGLVLGSSYNNLDYIRKAVSSNENVATVKAGKDTVNGNYSIKVDKLANGASFTSKEIAEDLGSSTISFKINGAPIDINKGTSNVTMDDIVKEINSTKIETYDGNVIIAGKVLDKDGNEIDIKDLSAEERQKIKNESVTAFYDKNNGRLFMQTKATGKGAQINISEGTFKTAIGFEGVPTEKELEEGAKYKGEAKYTIATDAKIIYNGIGLTYPSNNITFNGLTIELKAEGITNINVDTNVDGIFDKITKLIDDYNELVDKAGGAISEKRYSNYQPLSQDEKKAMHEDDVKLWTEKAKSGMLNRDENLTRILQNIRTDLYKTLDNPDGSFNHITQIGISTEKYSKGSVGGKLQIDEQKLRQAIMEDPEGVMELLFGEGNFKDGKEVDKDGNPLKSDSSTKGVFTRIYDDLIDGMKSIIDKSGPGEEADLFRNIKSNMLIDFVTKKSSISDLDKEVLEMNKKIDNLNIMLARKEQSYYAKFANMEKMLAQMNNQSSWIGQQLMR